MAEATSLELAVEGVTGVTPLRLSAKPGAALQVRDRTIRFAVGDEATYLSTAGGRVTAPPAAGQRLVLVPGATYRLSLDFAREGDGEVVLWLVEFAGPRKVATCTRRLEGTRIALTWHADLEHECALLAVRVRGTGALRIDRVQLQKLDVPALPDDPAVIAAGDAELPAVAPLALPERFDRDRSFAVLQLELLWQKGQLGAVDLGVVRAAPPPRVLAWLERAQIPALVRVASREDAAAVDAHLRGTYPIVVQLEGAAQAGWLASNPRLHGVADRGALDARTRRRRAHALAHPDLLAFPPVPETGDDCRVQGFAIVAPGDFSNQEFDDAKEFWKDYGVRSWYQVDKPWTGWLARWVQQTGAKRVLEFGCNAGRNLAGIRDLCPGVELVGIDINAEAVEAGRAHTGLDLRVADEAGLSGFADGSFDAVFTVSVLDHISDIAPVCAQLLRVAARHALFFEVRLPVEGRVDRHLDHKAGEVRRSTGASYSWHVERHLDAGRIAELTIVPTYLHSASLGPYYAAYFASLRAAP